MKKCFIIIGLAFALAGGYATVGIAKGPPSDPPGRDPCSHGNSGKDCRPDPSPNGKDCDPHGNQGGKNEDHCTDTTTTTTDTTTTDTGTTTTEPTGTTPTESTPTPIGPTPGQPPVVAPPGGITTPTVVVPGVSKKQLQKQLKKQEQQATKGIQNPGEVQAPGDLPYTGVPLLPVALLGGALSGLGLWLRRKS